jgi:hypothetical protein
MEVNNQQPIKSRSLRLFIILFLVSLGLSAFIFLKYAKNANKVQAQNEELALAYSVLQLDKDSMQVRLNIIQRQLQDRINENLAHFDLKEELRTQLEAKKRSLLAAHRRITTLINGHKGGKTAGESRQLLEAHKEITSLKQNNATYIAKIEQAQKEYKEAQAITQKHALKVGEIGVQKDSLMIANKALNKKLSTAGSIRIAGLTIEPIRRRKGEQEVIEKARKVERIKMKFTVLGGGLTEQGEQEIVVRIIAPNGTVLSKNTRRLTNTNDVYTLKNKIQYDGTEKRITYYYQHTAEYAKGSYRVELYDKNHLLDRRSFSLR